MFDSYTSYKECIPPGVLLPSIHISQDQYKAISADPSCSNFEFLEKLCSHGAKTKNISLAGRSAYGKRLKSELSILEKLGL